MDPVAGEKTMLAMRHAKSDWDADYESDRDRPLNERGVRSALLMGRLLDAFDLTPDLVLTSPATRAVETARLAGEAGRWDCPIIEEPVFYGGGPDSVIDIVAQATDADRLMVIGHEPGWSALVGRITGGRTEMKTASVAVVSLPIVEWADLPGAEGHLLTVHHPRSYFGSEWDPG